MYTISKSFSFCYGHRLLNDKGRCRHLHGHTAKALFVLGNDKLDKHGMVFHFDRLKETIGKWLEENFDHTLLLSEEDPMVKLLEKIGERIHTFPFNPTAENIARTLFEKAMSFGLPVIKVEVWESESAKASYEN